MLLNLGKPLAFFNLACKVGVGSEQYAAWEDSSAPCQQTKV